MKKASLVLVAIVLIGISLCTVSCSEDDPGGETFYTVGFDAGGGTPVPEAQKVKAGDKAAAPAANPAKDGYVFLFWSLSGTSSAYNFQTPVNSDITLIAEWREEAVVEYWQVSWNLNGGAWPSDDNHATRVVKGGTLAEPAAPTKEGITFDGWYKEADLTHQVSFPYNVSAVTADLTLYAKWTDYGPKADYFGVWRVVPDNGAWEQFTISADRMVWLVNSGEGCTIENLTWTEAYNQGGDYTADYTDGYRIRGTVTKMNDLNVPKDDGGGNAGVGDVVAVNFYIYSDKESIRLGNLQSSGHEARYGPYHKKFDAEYWQVTWELNGGAWPANDNHTTQVAKDGKLAAPAAPVKANNNFGGWYKEAGLINSVSFPYDVSSVTGNFTLYANWTDATPSVTLNVTVQPGAGFYTSITAMRVSSGSPSQYSIPTSAGKHAVKVSPGTYRIFSSYWACQYVSCMSSGYSSNFTVSSGQTKNIFCTSGAVGF
jgi:uncharacterized repeat protein (TIGR02543 family)